MLGRTTSGHAVGWMESIDAAAGEARLLLFDRPPTWRTKQTSDSPFSRLVKLPPHEGGQRLIAEVRVQFALKTDQYGTRPTNHVSALHLEFTEPVLEQKMHRFPWTKVLTAARAIVRARDVDTRAAWQKATEASWPLLPEAYRPDKRRPGRPRASPERDREVALIYNQAVLEGDRAPALRVAQALGVKPGTARGYVRRARLRGFLQPAEPGRAG